MTFVPPAFPLAPSVFDASDTERAVADAALRDLNIHQADLVASTAANRAAAAKATADSLNSTPLGTAPGLPVNSSGSVPLYVQPDFRNPPQRASVTPTAGNPMGLG